MEGRRLSLLDRAIIHFDGALRTVSGEPESVERANPAIGIEEAPLSKKERRVAGCLMRVNHAGEVSAQALYQGQALTARHPPVRTALERAALEESDHLLWCRQRVQELGTRTSYLNPFWYGGSLAMGALAGMTGDRWSLGFIAETEDQVIKHLDEHLDYLSIQDRRSRSILEQMRQDEAHHATVALERGGAGLPIPVRVLMGMVSKVMTRVAYWV